ncbi:cytochrome P450 [Thermoascus aurantiacus ATCC 26904]
MSFLNLLVLPLEGGLLLLITYLVIDEIIRWRLRIKGLPGPRGLPVVGNLPQVLWTFTAEQYRKWSLTYGPVYQVQLGNTPVVIVNSAASAKALFLTQSSALNSRPLFYLFHKLVSKDVASIGTGPWSESCKNRRKVAAAALNRIKVQSYEPIILRESREFIQELMKESHDGTTEVDFMPFVYRLSLNMVLTLNYGTRITETKDLTGNPLYAEIIEVEKEISKFRSTSKNLRNYVPLLRIIDPVVSALGLQTSASYSAQIRQRRIAYNNALLKRLQEEVATNTDFPCIQGSVLRDPESVSLSANELLSISLSMMAGADSTQPTIAWAILFLAHRPDIQQRAFHEIQRSGVLKADPFRTGEVHYVRALVKEIMRFYTVLPLAMPRATTAPVQFEGHTIPEGTMVFLNAWACNRDPDAFNRPGEFHPERWLGDSDKHTHQFAFGYGARMCVASHLASSLLYTVLLHLLAHFEVRPAAQDTDATIDPVKGLADPTALCFRAVRGRGLS